VLDFLHYMKLVLSEHIVLTIQKPTNEEIDYDIEKEIYEDLGLSFSPFLMDKSHHCANKCMFCFIDQLPCGMRESLYFKDDDWRLSYLSGNYVTFTNVSDKEIDRIIENRIQPLFVSVHSMRPELRRFMMKNPNAGNITKLFDKFLENGINVHCQFVLCPGVNDGAELEYSLEQLYRYNEIVESVALVPVGLTKHRQGLPSIDPYNPESAKAVIDINNRWQEKALNEIGRRFVFASDEFYLTADMDFPSFDEYEDFSQLENGVGMIAHFAYEFISLLEEESRKSKYKRVAIFTGASSYDFMSSIAEAAEEILNVKIDVHKCVNHFFGESITVTGLLTGSDIISAASQTDQKYDAVLISSSMLRYDSEDFLDGITLSDVKEKTGLNFVVVQTTASDLIDALLGV